MGGARRAARGMVGMLKGRYAVRIAQGAGDLARALALRSLCFRDGAAPDDDAFDPLCEHVLIEDAAGALVACYRLLPLVCGRDIGLSYSAQAYDLHRLSDFPDAMLEVGRFCVHPQVRDPDVVRIGWAALVRRVDAGRVGMLFGCTSFRGTDPAPYRDAFAHLAAMHPAPAQWAPMVRPGDIVRFDAAGPVDLRAAIAALPPLLRSYLAMGGWVSDHAVRDHDLATLHVFTGLEIAAIPPGRARVLRALAAG